MSTRPPRVNRKKAYIVTKVHLLFPIFCLFYVAVLVIFGTLYRSESATQIGGGAMGMGGTAYQVSRQEEEPDVEDRKCLNSRLPDEDL